MEVALNEEELLIEGDKSHLINNYIDDFMNNLTFYKEKISELEKLRKDFVNDYTINKIMNMRKEDYVVGFHSKDSFCYRLETELQQVGDIRGGYASKFGVYYGKSGDDLDKIYRFTKKFGDTLEEAFDKVKEEIVLLYIAGEKNDYEAIRKSKFGSVYRGKILSVFFPEKYISIFSDEHLDHFMDCLGISLNGNHYDTLDKQICLMEWKKANKKLSNLSNALFSAFLYESFGRPFDEVQENKELQKEKDKLYPIKYRTDIKISTKQWKELILDLSVFTKKDVELLKRFYCSENHATTCYDLSIQDGVDPTSYIMPIVSLAKRISKAKNLKPIYREDGSKVWWRIIFWGRYRDDNRFEWKLQPNLAKAFSEVFPELDINEVNEVEDNALVDELKHASLKELKDDFTYNEIKKAKATPIYTNGQKVFPRDRQVAVNALSHAGYLCEIDNEHPTFIRKNSDKNYTEPHHLVPIAYSGDFPVSLDVEENVVSLCSNCHNQIHYGRDAYMLIKKLYEERKELLKKVGINITYKRLLEMYNISEDD